ncbi:hypothetical protein BgiMline_002789, partial [Biomphalaria glabrata]
EKKKRLALPPFESNISKLESSLSGVMLGHLISERQVAGEEDIRSEECKEFK